MAALIARLRRPPLVTDYAGDLRLAPTMAKRLSLAALAVVFLLAPFQLDDFWLSVVNFAGVFAIGAVGLNLLTGYTGQVSLGHAFFMAIGSYVWAHFGSELGWPLYVWLPISAIVGGAVGGIVGPFALRLKGNYLAIVSVGLVFIGVHIWDNFESVTGGSIGYRGEPASDIGFTAFNELQVGSQDMSLHQGYFWLIWGVAALLTLVAKNIVRTRPGRAMQAVRDRDVAAAVVGVNLARAKVGAFVISSAYAAVAGALYGSYVGFVGPEQWNLFLSIQFIAVIIVGGIGTIFGPVLGALFIAGTPEIIDRFSDQIPLIESVGLPVETLKQLVFGVVIVFFLVVEPHGLAGIWFRVKSYFRSWPFSY